MSDLDDTATPVCRNCCTLPAVVAGLCSECAEAERTKLIEDIRHRYIQQARCEGKLERVISTLALMSAVGKPRADDDLGDSYERAGVRMAVKAIHAALGDESEATE